MMSMKRRPSSMLIGAFYQQSPDPAGSGERPRVYDSALKTFFITGSVSMIRSIRRLRSAIPSGFALQVFNL
jgi:hypothetical protein